jgi:hypothetical protein
MKVCALAAARGRQEARGTTARNRRAKGLILAICERALGQVRATRRALC